MTKTRLRTTDGKWFASFDFHFNGNKCESVTINLSENKSDAMICGKIEARERIKTAKICGVELVEETC